MGAAGGKAAAVPQQGMGMVQGVGQQGFGAVQGVGNTGMGAVQGVGNTGMGAVQGVGNTGMGAVNGVGNTAFGAAGGLPVVGGLAQGLNPFQQQQQLSAEQAEVQAAQTVAVAPSHVMPLNRRAGAQAQAEALKYKAPKMRTFGPSAQGSFAGFGGHYAGYPYGAYSQGAGYAPTFSQANSATIGSGIAPTVTTPGYGSQAAFGTVAAAPAPTFSSNWNAAAPTAYGATSFPGTVTGTASRTVSGQAGITSLGAPPVGYE